MTCQQHQVIIRGISILGWRYLQLLSILVRTQNMYPAQHEIQILNTLICKDITATRGFQEAFRGLIRAWILGRSEQIQILKKEFWNSACPAREQRSKNFVLTRGCRLKSEVFHGELATSQFFNQNTTTTVQYSFVSPNFPNLLTILRFFHEETEQFFDFLSLVSGRNQEVFHI